MPPTAGSSTAEELVHAAAAARPEPRFYFDLGWPEGWAAAERVLQTLPVPAPWVPVDLGPRPDVDWDALAALQRERDGLALKAPASWPVDAGLANAAATYARQIGRSVAFALAAFRQAYAGGRDLAEADTVLIAGSACEMHPTAILRAVETRSVRRPLAQETALARARGVLAAPAVWVPAHGEHDPGTTRGAVFHGDEALEAAAAALAA